MLGNYAELNLRSACLSLLDLDFIVVVVFQLGLILGTKLWFSFWPEAVDTEEKFIKQMDELQKAVGDRGKIKMTVAEGVPPMAAALALNPGVGPSPEPTPAPAPTVGLAPALDPALSTTPARNTVAPETPRMQVPPTTAAAHQQGMAMSSGGSLSEVVAIFKEQRDEAKAERAQAKAEREEMQAKVETRLEAQLIEHKARIAELTAPVPAAIMEEDILSLQARLETMHVSKLITDEVCAHKT